MKKENTKIDILFVDGDHRVEPCAADIMGFWDLVKDSGYLLIHDTDLESGWDGPNFSIESLRRQGFASSIDIGPEPGLTVIQKTQKSKPKIIPTWAYYTYIFRTKLRFWLKHG